MGNSVGANGWFSLTIFGEFSSKFFGIEAGPRESRGPDA